MKINQKKSGILLSYLSIAVSCITTLIYTPVMLRLLGSNEYGLYNLCASMIGYLSILNFGFNSSYVRYYVKYKAVDDKEGEERFNGLFILIFFALALVVLLCGSVLIHNIRFIMGSKLSDSEIVTGRILMMLMMINLALTLLCGAFSSIISAHEKYFFIRLVNLLKSIINPFLVLPLLLMGYKSVSIIVISLLLTIITLILNCFYVVKKLRVHFIFTQLNFRLILDISRFSFFIFLNMIIDQLSWQTDKYLLGRFQGTSSVAVYSFGSQFNDYFITLATTISSVFTPEIHQLNARNDHAGLSNLFTRIGRIQYLFIAAIYFGFVFWGKAFILFLGGDGYDESYYIALLLITSMIIPLSQTMGVEILRAQNIHQLRSIVYFFIALGNLCISIPLCQRFGAIGSAAGTFLAQLAGANLIMNILYARKTQIDLRHFWYELFKCSRGFILPVIYGIVIYRFSDLSSKGIFLITGILYVILYCISIWLFSLTALEKSQITDYIRKKLKR